MWNVQQMQDHISLWLEPLRKYKQFNHSSLGGAVPWLQIYHLNAPGEFLSGPVVRALNRVPSQKKKKCSNTLIHGFSPHRWCSLAPPELCPLWSGSDLGLRLSETLYIEVERLFLPFHTVHGVRRLDGHKSEQALGVGGGEGSLACCSPWDRKEWDTTERLN